MLRELMAEQPDDATMRFCPYCFGAVHSHQETETRYEYEYCSSDTVVGGPKEYISQRYECEGCGHHEDTDFSRQLNEMLLMDMN